MILLASYERVKPKIRHPQDQLTLATAPDTDIRPDCDEDDNIQATDDPKHYEQGLLGQYVVPQADLSTFICNKILHKSNLDESINKS